MLLLTPGPLTTAPAVREAMLRDHGSRDPAFIALCQRVWRGLEALAPGFRAIPVQGSGTFAVEAMLGSLVPRTGGVLVLVHGVYGRRAVELLKRMRRRVVVLEAEEGAEPDLERLRATLDVNPVVTHVFTVHSETTTGQLLPLKAICDVAVAAGRRVLVDAMSSFGAVPIDGAGIEGIAASGNKCLEGVPGLAFVLARTEALRAGRAPSVSLDLYAQAARLTKDGQFRFTPPTHVLAALDVALALHTAEGGVAGRGARYAENMRMLIAGMRERGFEPLLPDDRQGPIIATFHTPAWPNWHFDTFYERLRARGFAIYPGSLAKAPSFRVGCIGQVYPSDIARFLEAVDAALSDTQAPPPLTTKFTAVLFDLAGTSIDCGCLAPVDVFVEVFRRRGVTVSEASARAPMGTHKREHIRRMCVDPVVTAAWIAARGTPPTDADIDAMYAEAEPLQIACLPRHASPIPGFVDVATRLRNAGVRLGATTGYTAPMAEVLRPLIAAQGWEPEVLVCASDVPAGRPAPYMNQLAAMSLGVEDVRRVVVVGDTVVDMAAARNAGMWAVGVALTGNEVGLGWDALCALPDAERRTLRDRAAERLRAAGAHVVIDTVADLPGALAELG